MNVTRAVERKLHKKRESWNELTNASGKTVLGEVPISYASDYFHPLLLSESGDKRKKNIWSQEKKERRIL
jgi:hypothetical protein